MIKVYTDGSCLKNPDGPGGWAYYFELNNISKIGTGGHKSTTNNRMELTAVIEALKQIDSENENKNFNILIYTDSQYVIKCATGQFKKHKNIDLWADFDNVSKNKKIVFEWIKGHNGNTNNEKVDFLARNEAGKFKML